MSTFWLNFIVLEAVGVVNAFLQLSTIKPGIKTALQNFVLAAEALQQALSAGV